VTAPPATLETAATGNGLCEPGRDTGVLERTGVVGRGRLGVGCDGRCGRDGFGADVVGWGLPSGYAFQSSVGS